MKKQTKVLLTVLCAVLLVAGSIFGTMAYFTDADAAENTFTVGKVYIDLNETDVDNDDNTKANTYHLLPGHSYTKDPTVTILADSESCYVRMKVSVSDYGSLKAAFPENKYPNYYKGGHFMLENVVDGWDAGKWECVAISETGVYEFRYTSIVPATEEAKSLEPLFTKVVIPESVNNEELANLEGFRINVVAHAIQSAGFDDADAAWAAFDVQNP